MTQQRTGRKRLIAAAGLLCAAAVVGVTAAAYTDEARVNLGNGTKGSGVGNPDKFDIAVRDSGGALQDAVTPSAAVVLPVVSGTTFSEDTPVVFETVFVNRDPGIAGDLTFTLYDPDDSGATDVFRTLHYTVTLNGAATPAVSDAPASVVATTPLVVEDVAPGESVTVRVSALLPAGTNVTSVGKSTQLGVAANGESR